LQAILIEPVIDFPGAFHRTERGIEPPHGLRGRSHR
jgi:hypothetical protein